MSIIGTLTLVRLRRIDSQSTCCCFAFESDVRLTHLRCCPVDDVDVIRETKKLERPVEDRATDVVVQPRASNDTFQGDVEEQTGESVTLPQTPVRFERF